MAETSQLTLLTLDAMCKRIEAGLDNQKMQQDIMMIGNSQIRNLVNPATANTLQFISSTLSDIKGALAGINIEGNKLTPRHGGSYPQKNLRKLHKKSRRTRKH